MDEPTNFHVETGKKTASQAERKRLDFLELLLAASDLFAASSDYETALLRVAQLAVPRIADWCVVDLLRDDGSVEQLTIVHTNPAQVELARELRCRYTPDPDARVGVMKVIHTGHPELYPLVDDSFLEMVATDAEQRRELRRLNLRSAIIVPLKARGNVLGAITLATAESDRHFDGEDQALAEELARRAAIAIDNARLDRQAALLNEKLEQQVTRRTQELRESKAELEKQIREHQQDEEKFRSLLEAAPDAMVIVDEDGRIVLANAQTEQLFGYPRHELLGQNVETLIPQQLRDSHVEHRNHYHAAPRVRTAGAGLDLRGLRKDGSRFAVEISLSPLETGGETLVIAAIRDVTERLRTGEALKRKGEQLAEAQKLARLGSWDWNIASDELNWSAELYRIFGFGRDQFEPSYEAYLNHVHPEDRARVDDIVRHAHRTGQPFSYDTRIVRSDGVVRIIRGRGTVELDDAGKAVRMFGTAQDVTERRRAEDEMGQRTRQLAILNELAREMAGELNPRELCQMVAERLCNSFGYYSVGIFSVEESFHQLLLQGIAGVYAAIVSPGEYRQRVGEGIIGQAAETGETQLAADTRQHPAFFEAGEMEILSELAIPLEVGGRVLGVLNVDSEERDAFDRSDVTLLSTVGDQLALALENAQLFTQTERHAERAEALARVAARLTASLDLEAVLKAICEETAEALQTPIVTVRLYDEERQQLQYAHGVGVPHDFAERSRPLPRDLYEALPHEQGPTIRLDGVQALTDLPNAALYKEMDLRTVLGAAMLRKEELVGLLTVATTGETRRFSDNEVTLLCGLAAQAATAIQNAQLYRAERRQALELERSNRLITALGQVAARLETAHEPQSVITTVGHELKAAGMESCVALVDEEEQVFVLDYLSVDSQALDLAEKILGLSPRGIRIPFSQYPLFDEIYREAQPQYVADLRPHLREALPEGLQRITDRLLDLFNLDTNVASIYLPLLAEGQNFGVLGVWSSDLRPSDTHTLTVFAGQVATALNNAHLLQAQQRMTKRLEGLYQASLHLTSNLDLQSVLREILREVRAQVAARHSDIFLYDGQELSFGVALWDGEGFKDEPYSALRPNGLTYTVARSGEPLEIPDAKKHRLYRDNPWEGSIIGLPLRIGERVWGVMNVAFTEPHAFDQTDLRILRLLGDQAAIAIQNAHLYEQERRHAEQLERRVARRTAALEKQKRRQAALAALKLVISESDELQMLLQRIVEAVTGELPAAGSSIVLSDAQKDQFFTAASQLNVKSSNGRLEALADEHQVTQHIVEQGQALLINDVRHQPESQPHLVEFGTGAFAGVPLLAHGEALGVLNAWDEKPRQYTREDVSFLTALANRAALAIIKVRLYEELHTTNVELKRVNRLKDEFLASMSHELRTPLNTVLGLSAALAEGVYGSLNEKQYESMHYIEESGRHLLELIDDVLDVSKIEAGKIRPSLAWVSIASVCKAGLRLVQEPAREKQIEVTLELGDAAPMIRADKRRLKQILVNLLSNAVKFTPREGEVGLHVVGDAHDDLVHFTVWDTGIGIAEEDMETLFQPFVQLDAGFDRRHPGTGLGLSLVKRLTEMHGGEVAVESDVGQGSNFTVSLPLYGPDGSATKTPVPEPAALDREEMERGRRERKTDAVAPETRPVILLAEDDERNATFLADYLQSKQYRLVVAASGGEAIEQAREEQPALILMDIQMPDMDGLQTIRRIREDDELSDVPIIALTALAMAGDRERCLEAGADAYMSKPLDLQALTETVADYTAVRQ